MFYGDCRIVTKVSEKLVGPFCTEDGIKTFPETSLVVYNFERLHNPDRSFCMQDRQRAYNITLWRVRVLYIYLLSYSNSLVPFYSNLCRLQKWVLNFIVEPNRPFFLQWKLNNVFLLHAYGRLNMSLSGIWMFNPLPWKSNSTFLWCCRRFRKIAKSNYLLLHVYPSAVSVRMEQLGSHWTDFHEIWYMSIFEAMSRKLKFYYNLTRITATLLEDQYTFSIISHSFLLSMRNVAH